MRLLIIAGSLAVALGAFIAFKGLTVQSQGTVSFGPIHSTVHEQHTVPALIGWVAMVGGVLLVVAGSRRKR
jgi:hypothetical protein